MPNATTLIGREREQADLSQALEAARLGQGGLLLVAGEAGIGKTFFVRHALAQTSLRVLSTAAKEGMAAPYGPLTAVLRAHLRTAPEGFSGCGQLAGYLALLLPELGAPPASGDAATLLEAIRCALASLGQAAPTAVFLDDLHWADSATLEALPALAEDLERSPLLIIGAYRSDDIPRGHALRRLRSALRRQGRLREITLPALDAAGTAALAARQLGQALSPALAVRLHAQTEGVPFFIEEMAAALRASQRLRPGPSGLELERPDDLPLPESVRDAVLLRLESISTEAREALEIAAVAGSQVSLALAAELAGSDEGLGEALEAGLLLEVESGQASFRHTLIREAVYSAIAWSRRRRLHRQMAERLEARGGQAPIPELAEHWLAAHELRRGRLALLALAEGWCQVHAYRDAGAAIRRALEVWPPGEDELLRLDVVDRLGLCAQMHGDLPEAARAWQEVAEGRRQAGDYPRLADAQRRLASLYELQSQWEPAMAARQLAAEAFDQSHLPGEAAAERLAIAGHLSSAGHSGAAVEEATRAVEGAVRAARLDLQAAALAVKGEALASLGQHEIGRQTVQAALSLALEHNLIGPAAQAYYSLASVFDQAGDYAASRDTFQTSIEFCHTVGLSVMEQVCLACLGVVQREMGEWDRALRVCHDVLAAPDTYHVARLVAQAMVGSILGWRGQARRARSLLLPIPDEAHRLDKASLEIDSTLALACVEELLGNQAAAAARFRAVLQLAEQREERHYIVPALRWGATFFASLGAPDDVRACARALATIASVTGRREAVAALAHALGEAALLEGDARLAASQFSQALSALGDAEVPFDRAQITFRAGVALGAAGEREAAVERLVSAYHTARKLRAQPLARQAAQALAGLGEVVERRVGRRAAVQLAQAGLSARELEVLRQIRLGHTNREIAHDLFLSPRTVDMHVRNLLAKLDARSRTEAVGKALELGLLS